MKKINSYTELKEEKLRLEGRIRELETIIKEDWDTWTLKNTLEDIIIPGNKDGLMGETIAMSVDKLIKNLLLRRFSWPIRFVASYLAKNYALNTYSKNSSTIFEWITDKIAMWKGKRFSRERHKLSHEV